MDEKTVKEKVNMLAREVIDIGRQRILLKMRFFSHALHILSPVPEEKTTVSTDGNALFYDPSWVLSCYRRDQEEVLRFWLHPLMHCLFLHMFVDPSIRQEAWNLACDIACEAMIADLKLEELKGPIQTLREQELAKLREQVQPMTAEKLYHYLTTVEIPEEQVKEWEVLFCYDQHKLWYRLAGETFGEPDRRRKKVEGANYENADESEGGFGQVPENHKSLWKHVSEHMENDLSTFSREYGEKTGELVSALRSVHREPVDYRRFLRKFAKRSEVLKVSKEEFDYIFYTYGLELYQDIPLIEPLEYSEDLKIRDFVIIIDTSGSVQGDVVQQFLQKTYNILKQEEAFEHQFHLHIIQADSEIKRDDQIRNQRELDAYLQDLKLSGFGGTDFRPAIEHVEKLKQEGKFQKLKGVLYFTDGLGIYPEKCPSFQTAFVFVDSENAYYAKTPPWAIRVLLTKKELEIL